MAYVAEATGVPADLIVSKHCKRYISHARQQVMWYLHEEGYSFPEIGRVFQADHSTCVFAHQQIQRRGHPTFRLTPTEVLILRSSLVRAPRQVAIPKAKRTTAWRVRENCSDRVVGAAQRVAYRTGIDRDRILSNDRTREVVEARKQIWRDLLCAGVSITQIANGTRCSRKSVQRVRAEMDRLRQMDIAA